MIQELTPFIHIINKMINDKIIGLSNKIPEIDKMINNKIIGLSNKIPDNPDTGFFWSLKPVIKDAIIRYHYVECRNKKYD